MVLGQMSYNHGLFRKKIRAYLDCRNFTGIQSLGFFQWIAFRFLYLSYIVKGLCGHLEGVNMC
jgi:hypothetical protein